MLGIPYSAVRDSVQYNLTARLTARFIWLSRTCPSYSEAILIILRNFIAPSDEHLSGVSEQRDIVCNSSRIAAATGPHFCDRWPAGFLTVLVWHCSSESPPALFCVALLPNRLHRPALIRNHSHKNRSLVIDLPPFSGHYSPPQIRPCFSV